MDLDFRLLTPDEAAEFIGVTRRRVLQLPLKQRRLSDRTIRYRLQDIYDYLDIQNPNPDTEGEEEGDGG